MNAGTMIRAWQAPGRVDAGHRTTTLRKTRLATIMGWLSGLRTRLSQGLRRDAAASRAQEEIAFHIEMETEKHVSEGMAPAEARRRALVAFGGIERYGGALRDGRRWAWVEDVWQDVRHGLRSLRADVSWTVFAVLIVALGTGATVTVFSIVHALLLRPLPFDESERLVWIANGAYEATPSLAAGLSELTAQVVHLEDLRAGSRTLADVAGFSQFYAEGDHHLTGSGEPERVTGVPVTENFFSLLGVRPHIGRGFTAEESAWGGPKAVLLSHRFWSRRFASDPGIVGGTIELDRAAVTVIGVLPASFDFGTIFGDGRRIDFYSPFPLSPETNRQGNMLALVGRLAPGVTLGAARRETAALAERFGTAAGRNDFVPRLTGLQEHISGRVRPALLMLAAATGLVMLIVCANLSNLLLARAASREKEFVVRAALGAGRGRLVRQMLTEGAVLSFAGAVPGLLLAVAGTRRLSRTSALDLPLLDHVRVDPVVVGVALGLAIATALAFGLLSALRVASLDPQEGMKGESRGASAGRGQGRVRSALVVSEVALACVLLVGAGLLIRSFARLLDVDPGFQPERAVAVRIDPTGSFADAGLRTAYYDEALRRVRSAAGIDAAGLTDALPLGWTRRWGLRARGADGAEVRALTYVRVVSEDYFRALGVRLHAGRDLSRSDGSAGHPVVVINQSLARTFWPGEDPLGRSVSVCCVLRDGAWQRVDREVVGVVAGTRHRTLEQESGSELYMPLRQTGDFDAVYAVVRGAMPPAALAGTVRSALARLDPSLPTNEVRVIQALVDRSLSPRRLVLSLLTGFAAFALLLASLGIYGVISYGVAQRRREFGIRAALGESAASLQQRVLVHTLRLTAVGLAVGLAASWILARLIRTMLFGITFADPIAFASAIAILGGVAVLAGTVPARRAARTDAVDVLRAA
jgi:putative ABC transport system permease protein